MDTAEKIGAAFDVFKLRDAMVRDYSEYLRSFLNIRDERIRAKVDEMFDSGLLWPEPLIQMNPNFEPGSSVDELVDEGVLHSQCREIFAAKKDMENSMSPTATVATSPACQATRSGFGSPCSIASSLAGSMTRNI